MNWSNPWDLSGSSDSTGWGGESEIDWLVCISEDCWGRQGDGVKVLGTPVPERPLCGGTTRPLSGTGRPPQGWDIVPCSDWKKAKCPSQGNQRLTWDGLSPGVEYTFLCTFCLCASCALGVCRGFCPTTTSHPLQWLTHLRGRIECWLKVWSQGFEPSFCDLLVTLGQIIPLHDQFSYQQNGIRIASASPELARGLSKVIDLKCWEQRTHLVFVVIIT